MKPRYRYRVLALFLFMHLKLHARKTYRANHATESDSVISKFQHIRVETEFAEWASISVLILPYYE